MLVLVDLDFEQDAACLPGDKGLCFYVAFVHFVAGSVRIRLSLLDLDK